MKPLSLADAANQWQVSIPAAITRLIEAGELPFCLVSCNLVSTDNGEDDGRVMAKCKIDSMTLARLANEDELAVDVLSLLLANEFSNKDFVRIELPEGGHTYSAYPVPSEMKLTACNVMLDARIVNDVNSSQQSARPMPQQCHQEHEILRVIHELGYTANALPKRERGKNGVKAEVRAKLKFSVTVFDKAWERLRSQRDIQEAT